MDHFLHPWHYAPLLLALPFVPYAWWRLKSWWRGDDSGTASDEV